jgi:hypothetical protein
MQSYSSRSFLTCLVRLAYKIMVFVQNGIYINPARIDPALVFTHTSWGSTSFFCNHQTSTFVCISILYCRSSSLTELVRSPTKAGNPQNYHKNFEGVFHSVDGDRLPSMCCMALRTTSLKAPNKGNALMFTTRTTHNLSTCFC